MVSKYNFPKKGNHGSLEKVLITQAEKEQINLKHTAPECKMVLSE